MRFKRLRVSVGIALVIFMFIVANIILFGESMRDKAPVKDSPDQGIVAITDNKKALSQNITIDNRTTTDNGTQASQESKTPAGNGDVIVINETVPIVPPPEPVIVQPTRRTRAS